jgi:hypothetical protein
VSCGARTALKATSIEKEGEGAADDQPASGGGGETEARQRKARREMQQTDLLLKHPDATLATYV